MKSIIFVFMPLLFLQTDIAQRLTGTQSRDWIFERVETTLGGGDSCTKGEVWTFARTGTVEIRKCVNGLLHREQRPWSLRQENQLDTTIIIGPDSYTLLF